MRRDGIPYVQNPKSFYPPVDIQKLTLEELKAKYLKLCGKSNGNLSVCSKCKTPCPEGKRAIQLLANEVNDDKIPLYGGKTMMEMAKADTKRNREEAEAKKLAEAMELHSESKTKESSEEKPKKRRYIKGDEWWEQSLAYGNQVEYLIKEFGLSKTQAKKKIYSYKVNNNISDRPAMPQLKTPDPEPVKVDEYKEKSSNDLVTRTFEIKIDELMKLQTEYKAKAEEYNKKLKEVTEQIDVLCKAMDVFDKT